MTETCPHCGQALPERDQVAAKVDELLTACQARRIAVVDGYVREGDAAELLGWSRLTARNRRLADQPIPWRRLGRTPQYALADLARFIVRTESNFFA
jgi:hypothetical protein